MTYEVPLSQGAGTYWVHGHFNGQYVDGLRAPYTILSRNEPNRYDEDMTVIVADWWARLPRYWAASDSLTGITKSILSSSRAS